jgi:hypothetical protein
MNPIHSTFFSPVSATDRAHLIVTDLAALIIPGVEQKHNHGAPQATPSSFLLLPPSEAKEKILDRMLSVIPY